LAQADDDWLSKITEKKYGDPLAYPSIVSILNSELKYAFTIEEV
jgi:hypothetical protein